MAGFSLIKDTQETENEVLRIASQAYTIGDAVMLDRSSDSIDVVPATSSSTTTNIYAVAIQTVASSATECLFTVIQPWQKWKADSANNSNVSHNYQRMLMGSSASVVNNTGTDNTTKEAVFMQTGFEGTAAQKRLVGKFLKVANVTA